MADIENSGETKPKRNGLEEEGIAIRAFGLLELALRAQHVAEIVVRLRIVEAKRQRLSIGRGRVLVVVRIAQRIAEIEVRFSQGRIELDRSTTRRHGLG